MEGSDAQLVATWQQTGHRGALERLLERHVERVRNIVFPMVLDHDLADEITQEVFLRAIRGLRSFRGESEFSTWLHRIAMNCARSSYANKRPLPDDRLVAAASRVYEASPHDEAVTGELDGAIQQALGQLKPHLRAAVTLISINGMDAAEAARIEGCGVATMRWRLHEGRRRLRKALKGHL